MRIRKCFIHLVSRIMFCIWQKRKHNVVCNFLSGSFSQMVDVPHDRLVTSTITQFCEELRMFGSKCCMFHMLSLQCTIVHVSHATGVRSLTIHFIQSRRSSIEKSL